MSRARGSHLEPTRRPPARGRLAPSTRGVLAVALAAGVAAAPAPAPPRATAPVALPNDNRSPAGTRLGDTLVLRLVATRAAWHIHSARDPAFDVLAFAEEGKAPTIPGPLIRVRAGTAVRVAVRNPLADSLVVHGLGTRGDGAPDSLVVPPRATAEVRFASGRPGAYLYWASAGGRSIVRRRGPDSQLSGAFIVDSGGAARLPADRVLVITSFTDTLRADGSTFVGRHGVPLREFVALNGKSWPHTERLTSAVGDSIRWRVLNAAMTPHAMHLHGFYFGVDAKGDDAADADTAYAPGGRRMAVTEVLTQGQTMSMAWAPDRPGGWIFHCHMTNHAVRMPPIDRRDVMEHPAEHAHGDPDRHALSGMSGLVLATTVVGGPAAPAAWRPARRLRLLVQSDSAPGDSTRRFGYVLQRGAAAPAPDSVEYPGPVLLLTRGEPTAIDVVNRTAEPTAVHWHGIELESYYDGVVGLGGTPGRRTTPAIRPGGTFAVRITPPRAGTFMYHTHFNELRQQYGGLVGVLLVLEPGERWDPERDRVYTITDGVFRRVSINGSLAPPPADLIVGTTYRFRFANVAVDRPLTRVRLVRDTAHVADLGKVQPYVGDLLTWRPVAKDGWPLAGARATPRPSVQRVGSGETADFEFTPDRPGDITLDVIAGFVPDQGMIVLGAVRLRVAAAR